MEKDSVMRKRSGGEKESRMRERSGRKRESMMRMKNTVKGKGVNDEVGRSGGKRSLR
jgi:hypothetical protein